MTDQPQTIFSFNGLIMKKILLFTAAFSVYFFVKAQTPQLVKNINAQDQGTGLSSDNAVLGNNLFFYAGIQMWKTDGTPAGTLLIKDFTAEAAVSISRLVATSDAVYFMVSITGGYQMWKTDGTTAGTVLLKDFGTGQPLFYRAAAENIVLFSSTESSTGTELWKSDGTVAGTQIVKDINPGTASSNPYNMKNINGVLFFCAITSTGTGLWKSDGTEAGTVLITDLDPVSNGFGGSDLMTVVGNKAFFYFETAATGRELWVSDGTAAGTNMVKEIYAGSNGSFPNNLTALGDKLCFVAQDALNRQLWITDGTEAGTVPLYDAVPNSRNDSYTYLTNCNGTLYFSVGTSIISSTEPYISDGTTAGTVLLKDVNPGTQGSDARGYKYFNGRTYFIARTADAGYELWSSDGTEAGTALFTEIYPGTNNGVGGSYLIDGVLSSCIIFSGNHPDYREEPYSSDGTVAGTQLLKNIQTTGLGSFPLYLTPIGSKLYFNATIGFSDTELWHTDGTETGTQLFKDLEPGAPYSRPFGFLNVDNTNFYFRTYNSNNSRDIWKSDGTATGTTKIVADIQTEKMALADDILFFSKRDVTNGTELWKYDAGTASLVKNINPGGLNSFPSSLTAYNNLLYFFADDGINGSELWKSDGTDAGTQLVIDINTGSAGSATYRPMVIYNSNLFFLALKDGGVSLMKSDGTAAGTTEVTAFTNNSTPGNLFVSGSSLYFIKKNDNGSQVNAELWKTDGTSAGTVLVKEVLPYTTVEIDYIQDISFFTNGNRFYFYIDVENLFGETLQLAFWTSDGTAAGTQAVRSYQFATGDEPDIDDELDYVAAYDNSQVLFVFADDAAGMELWKTDGTAAGTSLVNDLNPGTAGSNPSGLVSFNNAIYFSASNGADLNELWKINNGTVVPLKLLSFRAYKKNKSVQLQWHTVNEINSSHFEIETSADGSSFTKIDHVTAGGSSSHYYSGEDAAPEAGLNYYRLKIVDKDGSFVYSNVIKLHFTLQMDIAVQPNPVHDYFIVTSTEQYKILRLLDVNGREVTRFERRADNRYMVTGLPKGIYVLQLIGDEVLAVKKMIIE